MLKSILFSVLFLIGLLTILTVIGGSRLAKERYVKDETNISKK